MNNRELLTIIGLGGIAYLLWRQKQGGIPVAQKRQWLIQYVQQGGDTPETKQKSSTLFGQTMTDAEINVVYKVLYDFANTGTRPTGALLAQFNAIGAKYNIFT